MSEFIAPLGEVCDWIRDLSSRHSVFFPQRHGEVSYRFEEIGKTSLVQFERYRPTTTPTVKLLFPARDELFRFVEKEGGEVEASPLVDATFRILAGVRPCDLKGIFLMDLFFDDGVSDPHYLTRRQNAAIIGYACPIPCDDRAFCAAVDSLDHRAGADVFLTPLDSGDLLVEATTKKGQDLIGDADWQTCRDSAAKKIGAVAARPDEFGRSFEARIEDLPGIVGGQWESPIWARHVERCFSCGTCNLVCPTCYCFDVHDDLNLDAASGTRARTWDGCMLPHFAGVAGGHNFRAEPAARQRHRVKRKFEYLPAKYGQGLACVGCGRCGRQCTSHIDIYDIVCDLSESGGQP